MKNMTHPECNTRKGWASEQDPSWAKLEEEESSQVEHKEGSDMSSQYSIYEQGVQASPEIAQQISQQLTAFVKPLLVELDPRLDLRWVQSFLQTLHVLLQFRHRNQGLLPSEWGAYLASPHHAPAGTKRVSNLLHSPNWQPQQIEQYLCQQAGTRLEQWEQEEETALLLWDERVLQRPESIKVQGLCAVRCVPRSPSQTDHTWLLQSPCWSCHVCAGNATFSRSLWAIQDSNLWPLPCQGSALTGLS
jgi:hypothetical protein